MRARGGYRERATICSLDPPRFPSLSHETSHPPSQRGKKFLLINRVGVTCFETYSISIHSFTEPGARRLRRRWARDTEGADTTRAYTSADTDAYADAYADADTCPGADTDADAGSRSRSCSRPYGTGGGKARSVEVAVRAEQHLEYADRQRRGVYPCEFVRRAG